METPLTPLEFKRRSARLYGEREAVVDGELRLTYAEFFDRCDRWSHALQAMGVKAGDRVAYICPNTHAQLESFYAVPQTGAVLVPINYRLTPQDFEYIIEHSGATVVCVHSDYYAGVESLRSRLPAVRHWVGLNDALDGWVDYEQVVSETSRDFRPVAIGESELITINYTSGTTARPKGVMMTHRNTYLNVVGTLLHLRVGIADRYLWTLPMFHANGWTFTWTVTAAGATHICLPAVEAGRVFRLVAEERVTWLCAAPTVLISLASATADLRGEVPRGVQVVTAGAPPAAATIEALEDQLGWDVIQMYGLTETAPFITVCEPRPEHATLPRYDRAQIKARQGVELITSGEVRVVGDDGAEVPHNGEAVGEITVRGNVVMAGYYRDPKATAAALKNGWFHTGDAAIVHEDGFVEIRDRIKDVIISGGENISSVEVEAALLRHPAVREVAVVGLPDPKWGESPHAFVVLKPGMSATEDELIAFARENLAHFKAPKKIHWIDELPKTATGKVQKFLLRGGAPAIGRQ